MSPAQRCGKGQLLALQGSQVHQHAAVREVKVRDCDDKHCLVIVTFTHSQARGEGEEPGREVPGGGAREGGARRWSQGEEPGGRARGRSQEEESGREGGRTI